MPQDKTSEHLRAELKSLADTLEEVLQSSTINQKLSWISSVLRQKAH